MMFKGMCRRGRLPTTRRDTSTRTPHRCPVSGDARLERQVTRHSGVVGAAALVALIGIAPVAIGQRAPAVGGAAAHPRSASGQPSHVRSSSTPGLTSERALLERATHSRTLGNGLEVVVVANHGVPLATIEIDVRNGSFTQTPDYAGLAHMYEHMFFKANAAYPQPEAFLDRTAELGAVFNGRTEEESVSYYLTLPADSLAGGMQFMAAALRTPLFLSSELAREKEVVIGEYDRQEANPFFALSQSMGHKLWPGNWSRKNVIGDRDVIKRVTPDQMREIQHRYYVPNNSVLIVTGDVDTARVFALAEQRFGDWPRAADPFVAYPIPPITPLAGNDAVIAEGPVSAVTVLIQWQGPSVGADPNATYAADVFSDALNMPGSAFQRHL